MQVAWATSSGGISTAPSSSLSRTCLRGMIFGTNGYVRHILYDFLSYIIKSEGSARLRGPKENFQHFLTIFIDSCAFGGFTSKQIANMNVHNMSVLLPLVFLEGTTTLVVPSWNFKHLKEWPEPQ